MAGKSNDFTVDDREWREAVKDYAQYSSKGHADAINGKHRDWIVKSIKYMPATTAGKVRASITPGLITWYANRVFGIGAWSNEREGTAESGRDADGKAAKDDTWEDAAKLLRKRVSSVKYMRHILTRAALTFPPIFDKDGKVKLFSNANKAAARTNIKSKGIMARPAQIIKVSEVVTVYGAKGRRDESKKDALLKRAMELSKGEVYKDMAQHLARKNARLARKYSAR
jgi:hypothetical protein